MMQIEVNGRTYGAEFLRNGLVRVTDGVSGLVGCWERTTGQARHGDLTRTSARHGISAAIVSVAS